MATQLRASIPRSSMGPMRKNCMSPIALVFYRFPRRSHSWMSMLCLWVGLTKAARGEAEARNGRGFPCPRRMRPKDAPNQPRTRNFAEMRWSYSFFGWYCNSLAVCSASLDGNSFVWKTMPAIPDISIHLPSTTHVSLCRGPGRSLTPAPPEAGLSPLQQQRGFSVWLRGDA